MPVSASRLSRSAQRSAGATALRRMIPTGERLSGAAIGSGSCSAAGSKFGVWRSREESLAGSRRFRLRVNGTGAERGAGDKRPAGSGFTRRSLPGSDHDAARRLHLRLSPTALLRSRDRLQRPRNLPPGGREGHRPLQVPSCFWLATPRFEDAGSPRLGGTRGLTRLLHPLSPMPDRRAGSSSRRRFRALPV
jgi:hypothetical protein